MSSETLIEVNNVSKKFSKDLKRSLWYGLTDVGKELVGLTDNNKDDLRKTEFWAVKDVSFELKRGECLGLVGRNGAGKTTLLKILTGLIKPDKGNIKIRGKVGALISLGTGFDPILTGRENIYINASILGISRSEIDEKIDEIIEFSELKDFIETPVRSYSSGMVSRLGFSIAVHIKPDVLILDEVLAVGDAGFRMKSLNKMYELMSDTAVIFVNHSMSTLSRVSNKIMYLKDGEVNYFGTNVLEGIEKYLSQFEDERSFIANKSMAEFHKIEIYSPHNRGFDLQGRPILNHSDDMLIDFEYDLNPSCNAHSLSIVVSNKDFITIFSHRTSAIYNSPDGKMKVTVRIPKVQLVNGEYSVTFKVEKYDENPDAPYENYATYRHWRKFKIQGLGDMSSVLLNVEGIVESVNGNQLVLK